MSETISSNALFHFTRSIEALKSILKNGFFPHYCPEYTLDPNDRRAAAKGLPPMWATPMVCFCDLPLSLIRKHLKAYGNFGIGLEKKWGVRNGVAPVIYTHSKAKTRPSVSRLVVEAPGAHGDLISRDMRYLAAYSKPFRGRAWRNNHVQKKTVRFYDEREWRYVPSIPWGGPLFLDWKEYNNASKRNKLHKKLKERNTLGIPPDAIQYLILPFEKDEENVLDLHDYLMKLYSRRDAILVATTIMTDNCIKEDI
jgi:hypothetical protein